MGKIGRVELPPGPIADLFEELRRLHRLAGEPSVREIAATIGEGVLSHATVHAALRGPRVPRWPVLDLVVEALEGDGPKFKALWVAARYAEDERPPPLNAVSASYLPTERPPRTRVDMVPGTDDLNAVIETDDGSATIVLRDADRLALAALFEPTLRDPLGPDRLPRTYAAAAARLGWPRTSLVKRIEYLRMRLHRAGVPNMTGYNAVAQLADYVIATGLLKTTDIDRLGREQNGT
ncbi:hypothetical protein HUT06_21535 [Actinomadura sp. NAK00032]|uniref:hypothetical protein n=1 Tax=Actinomadura sp. NAK00032 TaxID=2742128 RepID=UPI001590D5B9|nr:hypothetical protein [Actinomadura sp. NAK00032]QKW36295.1 hypothetical protein HUT06_21535 [Actinomadura sp. NAK00032]